MAYQDLGTVFDWPLYGGIVWIGPDWLAGISHGLEPETSFASANIKEVEVSNRNSGGPV